MNRSAWQVDLPPELGELAGQLTHPTHDWLDRLSKIEKPTQRSKRQARRLTEAEVRSLCASATRTYRPIVTTLAWRGVRVSEALRWQDIDFDNKEIHIRHQLAADGMLRTPKTKAGVRSIPLLPVLDEERRTHRKAQLKRGIASAEQPVFTTAAGQVLDSAQRSQPGDRSRGEEGRHYRCNNA